MNSATKFKTLALLLLVAGAFGFVRMDSQSIGKINFILGGQDDISILRAGRSDWQNARLYSSIYNGDQIKTQAETRCETKLTDRSIIRIGENTTFSFAADQLGKNIAAEIKTGRVWANISKLSIRNSFRVKTPTAVCAVRGTIYRIDADSSTKVMVYQGSVDVGPLWAVKSDTAQSREQKTFQPPHQVQGPVQVPGPFEVSLDQWVRIVAGQQIEVRADGKYYKSKIDNQIDRKDDWVAWNRQRDGVE
jgi:hypothetical protein